MNILLQGAMNEEIDFFLEYYKPYEERIFQGFCFYIADFKGNKVIISKTEKGIINATMATTIALMEFSIDLVINQGCAGAHTEHLKIGDIILGEKAVYINDFKAMQKSIGEGSNSLDWIPNKKRCYETYSTKSYLEIAKNVKFDSNVKVGIIGSGDMHSREYDRIMYLNKLFGEDCEDMESAAALRVCEIFGVDKLALRVISNNDLLLTEFNKTTCKALQKFVIDLINDIIEKISR